MGPLLGKESGDFLLGDLFGCMGWVWDITCIFFFCSFQCLIRWKNVSRSVKTCMRLGL